MNEMNLLCAQHAFELEFKFSKNPDAIKVFYDAILQVACKCEIICIESEFESLRSRIKELEDEDKITREVLTREQYWREEDQKKLKFAIQERDELKKLCDPILSDFYKSEWENGKDKIDSLTQALVDASEVFKAISDTYEDYSFAGRMSKEILVKIQPHLPDVKEAKE